MKQRFKNTDLTERKVINSILAFYAIASLQEVQDGLQWYNEAHSYCKELAARFNLTLSQTAGIIAAFSPQAGWEENKRYALTYLLNPNSKVRSQAQQDKANSILKLSNESAIFVVLSVREQAFKTKSFFLNIINPDLGTNVTIDRHAIAICIQQPDKTSALSEHYGKLTKTQYEFFQTCYIKTAAKIGILPHQLQAITWLTYRRCRDLKAHTTTMQWKPFDIEAF